MDDTPRARDELPEPFPASLLDALEPLSPATERFFSSSLSSCAWGDASGETTTQQVATPWRASAQSRRGRKRKPASDLKANLRRSKNRDGEKREIMFLRAYSEALEAELVQLKQKKAERLRAENSRPKPEGPAAVIETRKHLWESLALLRRGERKRSEEENARLTALWKAQQRFVAELQRCVAVPRDVCPAGGECARITFSALDVDMFDMLLRDLDELHNQTSRVHADTGLAALPETRYHSIQHRDVVGSGNIDLLDVTVLQSSYSTLKEGMWSDILTKFFARGGAQFHVSSEQSQRTVTMKMRYQATPEQLKAVKGDGESSDELFFEVVLAIRKYVVSPDRELVVWKSLNIGDGGLSGLTANETGHCVMHRSLLNPATTTMKRIRRLEPMVAAGILPIAAGKSDVRDDSDVPVEDVFSSLSLSAMEDDIDGALRNVGYD